MDQVSIDRFDAAVHCLQAIYELLVSASCANDLHLVNPDSLAFLLGSVLDQFTQARGPGAR